MIIIIMIIIIIIRLITIVIIIIFAVIYHHTLLWPTSTFTQPLWIPTGRSSMVVSVETMIITTNRNEYILVNQSSTNTFNHH